MTRSDLLAIGLVSLLAKASIGAAAIDSCEPIPFPGAFDDEQSLPCQGWNYDQQQDFWFLPQGSQIIPYQWFIALKQKGNDQDFTDPTYVNKFRYLPQVATPNNPDALPVDFTKGLTLGSDWYKSKANNWLGINCAACHTNQVEYTIDDKTHKFLIDGGPAMGDFEEFFVALALALEDTLNDSRKFITFADAVIDQKDGGATTRAELKKDLADVVAVRKFWNARNDGEYKYGFGRIDAIGAILNEVTVTAMGIDGNEKTANAPVNPPFIWNTPQYDFVQWDGRIYNRNSNGAGALGRNVGEVIGVFGDLQLNPSANVAKEGHTTSVKFKELGVLEDLLWELRSPKMPAVLRGEDKDTTVGAAIFATTCANCHKPIDEDSKLEFSASLIPVGSIDFSPLGLPVITPIGLGTDILRAKNFVTSLAQTGKYAGLPNLDSDVTVTQPINVRTRNLSGENESIEQRTIWRRTTITPFNSSAKLLRFAVAGSLAYELRTNPAEFFSVLHAGRPVPREYMKQNKPNPCNDRGFPAICYKARSLNGIWATGPFLHNGSVRTLKQVITGKRDATFKVGSREYDVAELGFVNEGEFEFDTSLPGNSNDGHLYGVHLNENQVDQLLNYLKSI